MLSNPKDREKLLNGIKELSNSMTRVDAEKDFQKEAVANLAEELNIKKAYIAKLATIYHKQIFSKVQQEREEIETLYELLISKTNVDQE